MLVKRYKRCPKCGSENSDTAKFCLKCGASLQNVEVFTDLPGANIFETSIDLTDTPTITAGKIPDGFVLAASVEVIGAGENYTEAWKTLMRNLKSILNIKGLDGVANYQVLLSPFQTSAAETKLTLMLYADGILSMKHKNKNPQKSDEKEGAL
ncbi:MULTISPECIES: zinc ribbon domain-containing protein [Furfurilactobacillus]|uniref:Zinc-ribbon domain-containing protein n=1 Tax=Furfurilactobacillus rossiae TaxID=231049 RepID=A0A7C9N2X1_9LACO|nr:zinc ribbon domain-containing protein [Furfurilactobacillus milii]MYV05409.1 zinc-ribbon domain-containing protein [Furfurilactobacillus milii]